MNRPLVRASLTNCTVESVRSDGRHLTGHFAAPRQRRSIAHPASSTFTKWWRRAESLAGLKHDERWGWHSLRRKFASELRNAPLRDVCDLGGWKSAATVLTRYQTPDPISMRRALASRNENVERERVRSPSSLTAKPA
jgi:integrase